MCTQKEEAGVSPLSDEAIIQAFLRLRSGTTDDTDHDTVDALIARLDCRIGCLIDGIIHEVDFRQVM